MRTRCFALLLLTSLAVAQTNQPVTQTPAAKPQMSAPTATPGAKPGPGIQKAEPADAAVAEAAPVITIDGVCETASADPANCKTVVTRAEFERMLTMVAPSRAGDPSQLPPAIKRNIATQYSQLVTVANAAEKEGIAKTPEAQELLRVARMQSLAQAFTRQLQQKLEPTDAEIQNFYKANASNLEQATLERIFVPKTQADKAKPAAKTPRSSTAKTSTASTNAAAASAEKLRQRAVAGEPFEKLQKEALAGSNFPSVPETRLVARKGTLPPAQEGVFKLKPGEVSQVFSEPAGFYIYKMVSTGPIPIDQVRDDIKQRVTQEKMQAAMDSILKSTKPLLNEQYFGPPPAAQIGSPEKGQSPADKAPTPGKPPQGAADKPKGELPPK
ncbi:MAG TPA: peptidylprolyl isomerase [Terriglobales bacterium]|nr:peptidylprolyl isomerase [Terriglobales bacterium]